MFSSLNWTNLFLGVLNLLIGGVLVAIVKSRPLLKKIDNDREANLLTERAVEMDSMRKRVADMEVRLDIALEELRLVRHDLANANHSLDMFIALIEANPSGAAEHAAKVKAIRATTASQIAAEKAELAKVRLSNIKGGGK